MATHKENYKSDIRLAVQLTLGGEPIPVPSHDFRLRFSVGGGRNYYDCTYIGGEGVNCSIDTENNKVICCLDNHELGIGVLRCEYYDYIPDAGFADGNMRKVVPSMLPVELIVGAGDDAEEIDVDVPTDVYGAIADCEAATEAANAAAANANQAALTANAAATNANTKASAAEAAATNANSAAASVNEVKSQAIIATSDAMAAATEAGDARDLANAAADRANAAAENANDAAERADALVPRMENLEHVIAVDDAEITLSNYAALQFVSQGANIDGNSVSIRFAANTQLRYQDAETTQTLNIASGTTYTVYQGYGLYYDVANNRIVMQELPASGEFVTLAVVSRGLVTQGKLLELTEHYERLQGGGGDLSNYYTKAETNATFLSKADATSDYYNKTQVDNKLNSYVSNDELGQKIADWTVIAAHFTGGTLDGTWRYYDGAKSIASIIGGTAEESTYAAFVTSLGYKMQGLDAIKPCVMDIVLGENNAVKTVDFIPFVGLYGTGTALFTALGNSADEAADATDVVSVHYRLDTERQSWERSEMDFANHIFELEGEVSGKAAKKVVVTFTENNGVWQASKTFAEINALSDAGTMVVASFPSAYDQDYAVLSFDDNPFPRIVGGKVTKSPTSSDLYFTTVEIGTSNNVTFARYNLTEYLTASAAASTYLSKSEAQSTYMTEGEVNAKNITAVHLQTPLGDGWRYFEGQFSAEELISGATIDNEITLNDFVWHCNSYLLGSTAKRIVVVEAWLQGTTPIISNVLPLVSFPDPSQTYVSLKFAGVGYPVRSNAAPANSCSLISYTLGDDGFGNLEWIRYEYDIDKLLAAKANTADVASTYATITAMNAGLADKADKVAVTNVVPQGGMLPNVVYNFGTTDTVNVILATPSDNTVENLYTFTFIAQSSSCTVLLPNNVEVGNEYKWNFTAGRKYVVCISDNDNIAFVGYANATNNS